MSSKLSSKSGNYMGKLRFSAGEYSLYKAGKGAGPPIGAGEEHALHAGMYFNKAKTASKKGCVAQRRVASFFSHSLFLFLPQFNDERCLTRPHLALVPT